MKGISKRAPGSREVFEDYATTPVPEEKRFGWLSQGAVWSGVALCMAMFSIGGMIASSMEFSMFLTAVLVGSAIITVIGSLIGFIGAKTHLPSAFNARFALGTEGGKIFGLILAVSLFGWFGYQCHYFAVSTVATLELFGFSGGSLAPWAIVGGLLMIITTVAGFNGITLLSNLGVPMLFALLLAATVITVGRVDFSVLELASAQASGMNLPSGVVLVVGSYITGACIIPDLSRFSKKPRHAVGGCILGLMVAYPFLLLLGGFFYYAYGNADPCYVFVTHCGMGMFVPFLLVVSAWTTNGYNLYCSVLGISNVLDGIARTPRSVLTLAVGGVSTLLGALGIMETFTAFLNLLGVLIPPIAAVIIADYYLYNRNSGLYAYENADRLRPFRWNTCLSALSGMGVGLLCNYAGIGPLNALCAVIPVSLVAMLASMAVLVVYNTFFAGRVS